MDYIYLHTAGIDTLTMTNECREGPALAFHCFIS
jgi:hypothetical protein